MAADRGAHTTPITAQLTEWDDVLIKKRICTREQCLIAKGLSVDQVADILIQEADDAAAQYRAQQDQLFAQAPHPAEGATLDEFDDLEDELDDDSALAKYRDRRIAEMKRHASRPQFGTLLDITRQDWMREVNDASTSAWIVVHLFQDYLESCVEIDDALRELAPRRMHVKFARIRATSAAEKWPDEHLPALLLYRNGKLDQQIIGTTELPPGHISSQRLDALLIERGVFEPLLHQDVVEPEHPALHTAESGWRRRLVDQDDDADLDAPSWKDDDDDLGRL